MSVPGIYRRMVNPEWVYVWAAAHGTPHLFSFNGYFVSPEPYITIGA